jgi:hypothetical protein
MSLSIELSLIVFWGGGVAHSRGGKECDTSSNGHPTPSLYHSKGLHTSIINASVYPIF